MILIEEGEKGEDRRSKESISVEGHMIFVQVRSCRGRKKMLTSSHFKGKTNSVHGCIIIIIYCHGGHRDAGDRS